MVSLTPEEQERTETFSDALRLVPIEGCRSCLRPIRVAQLYAASLRVVLKGVGSRSLIPPRGVTMPRTYSQCRMRTSENAPSTRLNA